ncbi:MAG: DUF58 domain-containing protein [Acidobacteria bacterium]|nr:DUF58 domain-containing protein [Acidobacteriota bacterium]
MGDFETGMLRAGKLQLVDPSAALQRTPGWVISADAGSSLEYLETREYTPGDDLRTIDWHAAARTERLMVKRYHRESLVHLDLVIDTSASMSLSADKKRAMGQLAGFWWTCARNAGFSAQMWRLSDGCLLMPVWDEHLHQAEFKSFDPGFVQWQNNGIRILISDLMWPEEPERVVARLAQGASAFLMLQVLAELDVNPGFQGWVQLEHLETGELLDVLFDERARTEYQRNLTRFQDVFRDLAERYRGQFGVVLAEGFVAGASFSDEIARLWLK